MGTLFGYSRAEWDIIIKWCKLNGIKYKKKNRSIIPDSPKRDTGGFCIAEMVAKDWADGCTLGEALEAMNAFEARHCGERPGEHHLLFKEEADNATDNH